MDSLNQVLQNRGRKQLYTDVPEVTVDNIVDILSKVTPYFQKNATDCQYLINFESGIQPLKRKKPKSYRPDIDFEIVDNVANEVVSFNLGFKWGYPMSLVQRGNQNDTEAISLLNEMYYQQGIHAKTQQLGRFTEVTGIGYTYVDINDDYEDGESLFTVNVLDPRTTFIVRSSYYVDRRPMLAVTFREDEIGNIHYTCFSKERRFEIINGYKIVNSIKSSERVEWKEDKYNGSKNPLGMIPIVEWFLSYDRQGCFERQIESMNNLNLLISDLANDVDQNTQSVWHTNDVDFPTDEVTDSDGNVSEVERKPQSGDWVQTYTSPDGKTPFIKPLTLDYDYEGILTNYMTQRALILQKCHVPQRNDNSGGSTGVAMDAASGWADAEAVAQAQQNILETCKLEEIRLVLKAIAINPKTPSNCPLLGLKTINIKPMIQRNKNYELAIKSTALATLINVGVYGKNAFETVNMFPDVNQVWDNSKELVEKHQNKIFGEEKEEKTEEVTYTSDNPIHQIENSPNIDGMSKETNDEPSGNG